jgi:hypothetical protein
MKASTMRPACNTGPSIQERTDSIRLFFSSRRAHQLLAPATVSPLIIYMLRILS